ncbi:hypothetical protein ACSS6N_09480 [Peribacillus frigoritolerans]|uniref:hypothetical protein n=1 Tax=Peribacillus frigoritolerans TaxID=450367 RepID=UPI003F857020
MIQMVQKRFHIPKEELIELYINQKQSADKIRKMYNCSPNTVAKLLREYNIPIRSVKEARKNTFEREVGFSITAKMIMEKVNEGMFVYQIGQLFGVSESTISNILNEAGIRLKHDENYKKFMYANRRMPEKDKDSPGYKKRIETINEANKKKTEAAQLRYETAHLKSWEEYKYACIQIANQHYTRERPDGYQLDHKYSVYHGYIKGVPASILSHPFNLRLITKEENLSKGQDSIITLEELYKGAGVPWDPSIKEMKKLTKSCEYCGKEFPYKNKDARFCKQSCAASWRWHNEYKDKIVNRNCVICRKSFSIRKTYPTVTCDRSCAAKLNHKNRKEKQMEKFNISKEELYDLYINKKKSKLEISKIYGCSNYWIDIFLKDFGVPQRNYSEQQLANFEKKLGFKITSDMILEKVNEGMFIYQIADMWGVSANTLSQILKKDGKSIVHRKVKDS